MTLLYFVYLGYIRPYIISSQQKLEVVQNIFLLSHCLIMPIYTDFVPDVHMRFKVGYLSIGLIGGQLILCFSVILKASFNSLKLTFRKYYNRCLH